MPAKPYSSGHIGAVAANYTQMRISGAVKQQLVELLCEIRPLSATDGV